jgi:penicillin amidase
MWWDGACEEQNVASAIFHVFHHRLMVNLLLPVLGEDLCTSYVEIFNQSLMPILEILRNPSSPWFSTKSRQALVTGSLGEACEQLKASFGEDLEFWQWGKIHNLSLNHPLGRIRLLSPLLRIGPFASPGDGTTVNMGFYRHSNPYTHTVGASLRFVIDVGGWQSNFILTSGQSGHPCSPYYRDQTSLWRSGRYIRMEMGADEPSDNLLTLAPA